MDGRGGLAGGTDGAAAGWDEEAEEVEEEEDVEVEQSVAAVVVAAAVVTGAAGELVALASTELHVTPICQ